jgi:hypothetical protein
MSKWPWRNREKDGECCNPGIIPDGNSPQFFPSETQFESMKAIEMNPLNMTLHLRNSIAQGKWCVAKFVKLPQFLMDLLASFYVHQLHIEDESWVLWYLPHSFAPIPTKGESGSTKIRQRLRRTASDTKQCQGIYPMEGGMVSLLLSPTRIPVNKHKAWNLHWSITVVFKTNIERQICSTYHWRQRPSHW